MSTHEQLFQPLQLGNLTLPNRVVMTTVKLGYGNKKGEVNQRHIACLISSEDGYLTVKSQHRPDKNTKSSPMSGLYKLITLGEASNIGELTAVKYGI